MANGVPLQGEKEPNVEPRETAQQIAVQQIADDEQRADAELLDLWRSVRGPYAKLDGSLIRFAAKIRASLTADLAQARQENEAWKAKQQGYESEADRLTALVAAAEQARDEAQGYVREHDRAWREVRAGLEPDAYQDGSFDLHHAIRHRIDEAVRTALLEAAEEADRMIKAYLASQEVDDEAGYPPYHLALMARWLTTRAGGPRT